ncbi:MAG: hypothetical protein LBS62_06430 [Clostridiales bacterium]|nr:hypothetical protein [Clostridiales bacterium]
MDSRDIVLAFFLAMAVTGMFYCVSVAVRTAIARQNGNKFAKGEYDEIYRKCCAYFQKSTLMFCGKTILRGTAVRVSARNRAAVRGQFIGLNHENAMCVLTETEVIIFGLEVVEEIEVE